MMTSRVGARTRGVAIPVSKADTGAFAGGPLATTAMGARAKQGKGRGVPPPKNIVDINIDEVIVRDGQLVALGNIGGQAIEFR